ncbi:MAG: HAD-IA family hydrolase [Acidobacteria bacterium]|nr:HAD-IA family hydrolase [Acidobacteriota bacterium]
MNIENLYFPAGKIKSVFFDAAGTLFDVKDSVGEIYSSFARQYGADPNPQMIQADFVRYFSQQPPLAFERGMADIRRNELERNWWRLIVESVFAGHPIRQFDQFFDELFEYFRTGDAWRLYDDVLPTLLKLKKNGIGLGVISNFDSRLPDLLSNLGIFDLFDSVHISSCEGAAKPDPVIFISALGFHKIKPEEAIHVGDSLREDFEGAQSAGLSAVLIDRIGQNKSNYCITRLDELMNS